MTASATPENYTTLTDVTFVVLRFRFDNADRLPMWKLRRRDDRQGRQWSDSGPWIAPVRVLPAFSNWKVAASDRGDEMRMITMPGFTAEEAVYTSVQIAMPRMET
jgi:hypothetical protein